MDIGLYREDEQFTFTSSVYMEYCSSDSTSFTADPNDDPDDLFEEIRPMRQPPTELFEWETDRTERQLQGENVVLPSITTELPGFVQEQNWEPVWEQKTNIKQESKEIGTTEQLSTFQQEPHILETFNDFKFPSLNIECNMKQENENKRACRRVSYRTESESSDILNASFSSSELTNFDIAEYVFEEDKQTRKSIKVEPQEPKRTEKVLKMGMKKIDLKAQKYIIEETSEDSSDLKVQRTIKETIKEEDSECDVDIETVSEEESSTILEAGDIKDLLEQFEATEVTNIEQTKCQNLSLDVKVQIKCEPTVIQENVDECKDVKGKKVKVEKKLEQKVIKPKPATTNNRKPTVPKPPPLVQKLAPAPPVPKLAPPLIAAPAGNRQVLASLPQDLINRIKESSSGKRKPITVIQPIPPANVKKKGKSEKSEPPTPPPGVKEEEEEEEPPKVPVDCATVHLDHSYCSTAKQIVSSKNRNSTGFSGVKEEDKGGIISRQPTVKNADGTLMVSLLKANTIRQIEPPTLTTIKNEKKKLNLEEYKKRRNGIMIPKTTHSQNNNSCHKRPGPEDPHQKMLKHQEKLRKMAQEVLNALPKAPAPIKQEEPTTPRDNMTDIKTEPPKVPDNLERKVFVSFGVNTDIKVKKNEDPLAPVVKLQEIKPLLERASDKINGSSLISSVIETIPKVLEKNEKENEEKPIKDEVHGEHKQVVFLEKDRPRCETRDAETQTDISLIEQRRRGKTRKRRVSSSSSSDGSVTSRRSRKTSGSSMSSRSSTSSYSSRSSSYSYSSRASSRLSYSRSRSRSPGSRPRRRRRNSTAEREHLNAVEERRIIYVGKIKTGTTKDDLRRKFERFGTITKVSLHFRDIGDNYGFVTFKYKESAHKAYEHGNDDETFPEYKISFGGRREFCQAAYSDLDNVRDDGYYHSQTNGGDSYDQLLQEALEKLKKRKV
ncbi:peroxisome proliferator-activated receptor gamma coactivator-related protein 1 isoform X2 [Anthonomus grandis grandis]|uniref:peroxisome proliferator-activated receptor gamma coactivator-related protein 1 isoform X2 n=1 Tax=Anthonomus grandis grandis TaxID=2921223 RepID=UPI002165A691|nr:peroxisome proliferator-activated receptor gamma coactivator-related protein 1 isoform X2 [Anthonomus grandis grandis]